MPLRLGENGKQKVQRGECYSENCNAGFRKNHLEIISTNYLVFFYFLRLLMGNSNNPEIVLDTF